MKSIFTLLKANLRHKNGSFISIIALMAIITFSFSGTVSNNDNLKKAFSDSMDNYEIGDLIVTLNYDDAEEFCERAKENPHVKSAHVEERIAVNAGLNIEGKQYDSHLRIAKYDSRLRVFNDDITGFEKDAEPADGEIYVSYTFSQMMKIKKGDEIKIQTAYGDEVFHAAGFFEDPLYGSMLISVEHMYVSENDYSRLMNEKLDDRNAPFRYLEKYGMLHIRKNGDIKYSELSKELNDEFGLTDKAILYINRYELESSVMAFSDTGTKLLAVFVIILTAVIILIIHNNIQTTIKFEYTDLGILKSQGFSTWKIRQIFILQYLLALLTGAAAGLVLSFPLLKILGKMFIKLTDIMTYGNISIGKCSLMALVVSLVCVIFVMFSTLKVSKISPVKAINGGHGDIYFRSRVSTKIKKKPLTFYLALREMTSGIRAVAGIILITALLVFFMISISIMSDSLKTEYLFGIDDNKKAVFSLFDNYDFSDTEEIISSVKEHSESAKVIVYSQYDNTFINDAVEPVMVTNDIDYFDKIINGRIPRYSNEIAISEFYEEDNGFRIGDTLSIHTNDATEEFVITGIFQQIFNGGSVIMNEEAGSRLCIPAESGIIIINDGDEADEIVDMLNEKYSDVLRAQKYEPGQLEKGEIALIESLLDMVSAIVYSISVVFAFVVVTMMCRKAVMMERRNIGIFRAVGFSVEQQRLQFAVRFSVSAITGSSLGAAAAVFISKKMFRIIFRSIGITDFIRDFSVQLILIPALVISISFFVFAYLASNGVKKISVRELITE